VDYLPQRTRGDSINKQLQTETDKQPTNISSRPFSLLYRRVPGGDIKNKQQHEKQPTTIDRNMMTDTR